MKQTAISLTLRPYRPADCPAMARLFYETVHTVNARDYAPEALDAWADGQPDLERWNSSFLAHRTLLAEAGGQLLGFADMDETGYLDRLYVHHLHQGRGVASALCDALEAHFAVPRYETHASITARPFFSQRGYQVIREQQVLRKGVLLTNFVMVKPRPASGRQRPARRACCTGSSGTAPSPSARS